MDVAGALDLGHTFVACPPQIRTIVQALMQVVGKPVHRGTAGPADLILPLLDGTRQQITPTDGTRLTNILDGHVSPEMTIED